MVNPVVFAVAHIHQAIVSTPPICVNHAFQTYFAPNNLLKRSLFTIRDQLRVNPALSLKDSKNGLLVGSSATLAFASETPDSACSKVAFVTFDLPIQFCKLYCLVVIDAQSEQMVETVDSLSIETHELGSLSGVNIQAKMTHDFSYLVRT